MNKTSGTKQPFPCKHKITRFHDVGWFQNLSDASFKALLPHHFDVKEHGVFSSWNLKKKKFHHFIINIVYPLMSQVKNIASVKSK